MHDEIGKLAVSLLCLFVGIGVLILSLQIASLVLGLEALLIISMAICGILGCKF